MLKKLPLLILAVVVFIASIIFLRPAPAKGVLVATGDFPAGHTLAAADVALRDLPANALPKDVLLKPELAVGQTLKIARGAGDIIRSSQLGEPIALASNERAIAIKVVDTSGVAGLLRPGALVGVVAVVPSQDFSASGWYTKAAIEGLRVLYVDPAWAASDTSSVAPAATPAASGGLTGSSFTQDRAREGTVVLAVPTDLKTIFYDFSSSSNGLQSETQSVNALELLSALTITDSAKLSLYLMPGENAAGFTSPGLWVPDLIKGLETATPTPTPTGRPAIP